MENSFGSVKSPFDKGEVAKEEIIQAPNASVTLDEKDKEVVEEKSEVIEPVESKPVEVREVVKTKKQQILESHGGLESNVPLNSRYWKL